MYNKEEDKGWHFLQNKYERNLFINPLQNMDGQMMCMLKNKEKKK